MINKIEAIKSIMIDDIKALKNREVQALFNQVEFGKMLRSKLMLCIFEQALDKSKEHYLLRACAVIELVQLASLLHDDVIDNATIRRANPTINATFGDRSAIMLGDVIYSYAFLKMLDLSKISPKIPKSIAQAVVNLSMGEVLDVAMASNFQNDLDAYKNMISLKTASLIASSCEISALISGLDPQIYYNFGLNLGICYQIVDDLLDLKSDKEILGKNNFSDFSEGKTTLPYMLLFEKLNKDDKKRLKDLHKKPLDPINKTFIVTKMKEFNIFDETQNVAQDFAKKALLYVKNKELENITLDLLKRVK